MWLVINLKGIQMIKYFTAPHEIMNRSNELHYGLLDFDTNSEMKLFIAILANATMIYRTNKEKWSQTFSLKGYLGDDSFLPRKSLTFKKVERFINNLNSPFFDMLISENKVVSFVLSEKYIAMIEGSGFNKICLHSLKSLTNIRLTKLSILTQIKPNGYFDLYYLFKALKLNTIARRDNKIAKINTSFSNLNIKWEYKYPANQNDEKLAEHFKFHYSMLAETSKNKVINSSVSYLPVDEDKARKEPQNKSIEATINNDLAFMKTAYLDCVG